MTRLTPVVGLMCLLAVGVLAGAESSMDCGRSSTSMLSLSVSVCSSDASSRAAYRFPVDPRRVGVGSSLMSELCEPVGDWGEYVAPPV